MAPKRHDAYGDSIVEWARAEVYSQYVHFAKQATLDEHVDLFAQLCEVATTAEGECKLARSKFQVPSVLEVETVRAHAHGERRAQGMCRMVRVHPIMFTDPADGKPRFGIIVMNEFSDVVKF